MIRPKNITDFFVKLPGYIFVCICTGIALFLVVAAPIALIATIIELVS